MINLLEKPQSLNVEGQQGRSKYSVLIIGAGGQGSASDEPGSGNESKIISFAHACKEHPGFYINGFIDSDITKANEATKAWGGHIFSSIKNAFGVSQMETYGLIDVAIVSTPDDTHHEILKELANYPLRLVICEKPLCETVEQTKEIIALYKARGIPILVNYTRRFLPYYEELKRRYEAGEFGELLFAQWNCNRGILHTESHVHDFIEWFFNREVNETIDWDGDVLEKADYRIWQIQLFFEKYFWQEQRIGDMPIWDYYDKTHWYVMDNAFEFLEGREPLKCDAEDGLRALEICYGLMEGAN